MNVNQGDICRLPRRARQSKKIWHKILVFVRNCTKWVILNTKPPHSKSTSYNRMMTRFSFFIARCISLLLCNLHKNFVYITCVFILFLPLYEKAIKIRFFVSIRHYNRLDGHDEIVIDFMNMSCYCYPIKIGILLTENFCAIYFDLLV